MEYRLNKYISRSGFCSRRDADRFIEEGKVTVNGRRASIGMRVLPGQKVKVNGELIVNEIEPVYIDFNKPVGIVSTTDSQEKYKIINVIRHDQRIFPIGRLDKYSQGLILVTNDGDIVNKILRAGNGHEKEYRVFVDKPISAEFIKNMRSGVKILGTTTQPCFVKQEGDKGFKIILKQGLNRQIRRMAETLGYKVIALKRVRIMHMNLGNLPSGKWRYFTSDEITEMNNLLATSSKFVDAEGMGE